MSKIKTYRSGKIHTITAVALFTALAYVCCVVFHFKVSFLSFDLKDAVMALGAMLLGPLWGLAMVAAVALIEFATISSTGVYGLIMNLISSGIFVCLGSMIYSLKRTMKGAVAGMSASVLGTTGAMMLANLFITPFFMTATTGNTVTTEQIAEMIPVLFLPFNLTKTVFNAAIVFILYTPVSKAMRFAGFSTGAQGSEAGKSKKVTVIVTVTAAVIAAAALVYFFVVLKGSFSLELKK